MKSISTKKIMVILSICLILAEFSISPTSAIENGRDATSSEFVVPLAAQYNATRVVSCSGALLSANIVATAAHCILTSEGLVSTNIRVGAPGSKFWVDNTWSKVLDVVITPTFQTSGKVSPDDLVFLILDKSFITTIKVRLASEDESLAIKNSGGPLKIYGYGYTTDNATDVPDFPSVMDGNFSGISATGLTNSGYVVSTSSGVCKGDSGGPVLSINPREVILVGVTTGSTPSNNCSTKTNGSYFSLFTLISRYANLAFAASLAQQKQELEANNKYRDSVALSDSSFNSDIEDLNSEILKLQLEVSNLSQKIQNLTVGITCAKGKTRKVIKSENPKCPSGFKIV